MDGTFWLSVALGVGIGLLYGIASLATLWLAARFDRAQLFMLVFFGGMMVRLAVALALVGLVLTFLAVQALAFVGSFLVVFLIGLVIEISRLHRGYMANSGS